MRFVYLDEAGISSHEPIVTVAGVIVDGDRQWKQMESKIKALIATCVPKEQRHGFAFHAKELFHGTGLFDRSLWPLKKRLEILKAILAIPIEILAPVVFGFYRKSDEVTEPIPAKERAAYEQVLAFQLAVFASEHYMRSSAGADEVAVLVAEDNQQARSVLKKIHAQINQKGYPANAPSTIGGKYLPLERIVDTVHFAAKSESILLQIADACAFAINRFLSKRSHAEDLFDVLARGRRPAQADAAGSWYIMEPKTTSEAPRRA